jgi:hypothetical protein
MVKKCKENQQESRMEPRIFPEPLPRSEQAKNYGRQAINQTSIS